MKIDLSPLKEQINHMALKMGMILFVPLIVGLVVKMILIKVKLPNIIVNYASIAVFLFTFYKMILIVLG